MGDMRAFVQENERRGPLENEVSLLGVVSLEFVGLGDRRWKVFRPPRVGAAKVARPGPERLSSCHEAFVVRVRRPDLVTAQLRLLHGLFVANHPRVDERPQQFQ